jgi:hypothetical protein
VRSIALPLLPQERESRIGASVPEGGHPSVTAERYEARAERAPWQEAPPSEPWFAETQEARPSPARAALPAPWTPEHERALAEVVETALARQRRTGSLEVTELAHRRVRREVPAPAAPLGLPAPSGVPLGISSAQLAEALGISSAPGLGPQPAAGRGFWFNINAELIIYGATEPDARVTIGGRALRLRPDGTFSCRFALPDGQYELPVAAVSAHEDVRRADLSFSRRTGYTGEVGAHPQDKALKPPAPENVPMQ